MAKNTRILVQEGNTPQSEGEFLKEKLSSSTKVGDMIQKDSAPKGEPKSEPESEMLNKVLQRLESLESTIAEKDAKIAELETAKDEATEQAKGAIAELQSQHQTELNAAKAEKAEVEGRVSRLEGLFKLTGNQNPITTEAEAKAPSMPNVNTITAANNSPKGMFAEVESILRRSPVAEKYTAKGNLVRTRDSRELDSYVRRAMTENRSQFIADVEAYAKQNGLLRGPGTKITSQDAATVGTDIDGGFLDTLAAIMRVTHRPRYISRHCANTVLDFAQGNGDTIKIPRAPFQTGASDPDDRLLSGNGTYASIDSTNQAILAGVVSATIQEWGLGKNSSHPPIGIPSFVQAYSMISLLQILERNLAEDYFKWEDLKVRSLWDPTSRVVYNDGDEVSTTVGNADGGITLQFLNNLFAYMQGLQIPTYSDGCYGLVLTPTPAAQFQNELIADSIWQATTPTALDELANMMTLASGQEMGAVDLASAYMGKYGQFHIFTTNAYGTGAAGTEGVQTETVAAGSATTRTNYAFGADTIGRGIGTAMEIRRDIDDDFGRIGRYIWRSEEGFVAMDVDPTGYSSTGDGAQQLRVIDVRSIG